MTETKANYRRYRDGDSTPPPFEERIFIADTSYKCPVYLHRTPPCQGSCPSGEDVRGWLNVVRGLERPPADMNWQEYAFRRITDANPFPAVMGRVCPAPCEDGCNRNEVEDHVGINAVEHYIGDVALEEKFALWGAGDDTGKSVAIIGGGPAGLAAAYQLRRKGHRCTIFESKSDLGGMMRYGIPGYRTPRDVLDGEINRILGLGGIEVRTGTKIGVDVELDELRSGHDAIFLGVGAQSGTPMPYPGAAEASNCISGIAFLEAFNDGRLHHSAERVLVVGGGDTAMDVAAVARRLGHISQVHEKDRPEYAVLGQTAHDVASVARREGAEVTIVYRRPVEKMPAAKQEIAHVLQEGVEIRSSLAPVELVMDAPDRARALRVVPVDWVDGKMNVREGEEFDIDCDLVVAAIGQIGDFEGMEEFDNGRGLVDADGLQRWPKGEGVFVAGDVIRPHLLTTAIGQAWIASESIDHYVKGASPGRSPKVNVHHFSLLSKLREAGFEPEEADHVEHRGTDTAGFAIHNYEDRGHAELVTADQVFLGYYTHVPRHRRSEQDISEDNVLGHFDERLHRFTDDEARSEADRCMSCGMCSECDNCIVYCPQDAIARVKRDRATMGRYVETDYGKCIGCHICMDVCPSGYIQMGLGE